MVGQLKAILCVSICCCIRHSQTDVRTLSLARLNLPFLNLPSLILAHSGMSLP